MLSRSKINLFLGISCTFWLVVMGLIFRAHYIKKVDPELGYFSADITFDSGTRQYFSILKGDRKIGYNIETQIYDPQMIFMEDCIIKMNLAGMSREVFIQCVVSIDSTSFLSKHLNFTIQSGSHAYHCEGSVRSDSLIIRVKTNTQAPWRKGFFIVDENITFPIALPFYMHRSKADTMSIWVFDPVIFSPYIVDIIRRGRETLFIDDQQYDVVRYDLNLSNIQSSVWLDENGKMVKSNGNMLFYGEFGELTIEKTLDRNVFLLPLEVTLGNDIIKNTIIYPDKPIPDPRNTQYLEIQLDGIRAANIDVSASNKQLLSFNPVIFGIHNRPVISGESMLSEMMIAVSDTSIVGISDYIQSKDARIIRTAQKIVASEVDTLTMARTINRWVFENVKKESGLDITRSIDILKEMRGDCDEHTKLFTALARSIGIPTQINAGLLYKDGVFRYHSWPSIFAGGVWHNIDPTLGQDIPDATHIVLIRGDFDRLVELLRLLGRISIKILDYR